MVRGVTWVVLVAGTFTAGTGWWLTPSHGEQSTGRELLSPVGQPSDDAQPASVVQNNPNNPRPTTRRRTPGNSRASTQPVAPQRKYKLTYKLSEGSEKWDPEIRARIVDAMDKAVALYNEHGEFNRELTANYSPGTPTADANYNGWINFGGQIGRRTALHEIGHTLGVGTTSAWQRLLVNGKWTGPSANSLIQAFDGPGAVISGDRQHFWPYGLNFDNESSPINDIRHVKLVAAFREDMGITNEPGRGTDGR